MTTPAIIVRCLKSDIGDIDSCIRYAEQIASNSTMNPWADPATACNYSEAARILKAEKDTNARKQWDANQIKDDLEWLTGTGRFAQ